MGAWGRGLLQNDDTQDALVDVLHGVANDLSKLRRRRANEAVAARAGAAVGVLLQLSAGYWFSAENDRDWPIIRTVLERQRPAFDELPAAAARLLTEVLEGKGSDLAGRDGPPNEPLALALYGNRREGFLVERPFGLREPSPFEHPEAARYVQQVADRLVKQADKGFNDDDALNDISTDGGDAVVAVTVLLVLEPCRVDPERFASWRARFRAALAELTADGPLDDYETELNEHLESAFALGIQKFSTV
jgi:hypothetical protein